MNSQGHESDALVELLRGADARVPVPALKPGLAEQVRRLARRRRRRRRMVTGSMLALTCVAFGGLVVNTLRHRPANQPVATVQPAPAPAPPPTTGTIAPAELARVRADAETRLAVARAVVARERRRRELGRLDRALAEALPGQLNRIDALRAEAAVTLVGHAGHLSARASSPTDAMAVYRRAIELFPDTPSAAVARRRIRELQSDVQDQETPL